MVLPIALALMATAGYNNYRRNEANAARQAKIDAAADEDRQWQRDERARMASMRKDVADAGALRSVEDGTIYQPAVDDDGNAMPANPTAGTFKSDGRRFATMAEATQAAEAANTAPSRTARMSAALEKYGEFGQAAQLRAGARQEELAGIQLDRTKKQVKREDALFDFGRAVAGGDWAGLPKVYERYNDDNTVAVQPDGKGGATVTWIGKDGKPLGSKPYGAITDFMADAYAAFDPEKWLGMQEKKAERKQAQDNADRTFTLHEQQVRASMANDAARTRIAGAAEGRAAAAAAAEAKIQPAVKLAYQPIAKQMDMIEQAIAKAQADGSWAPDSPGAQSLLVQRAKLAADANRLLAPYLPAGGTTAKDPLGLGVDEPAAEARQPVQSKPPMARMVPPPAPAQQAYQQLMRYGSKQRAADPEGYAAAKAAYEAELAKEKAAAPAYDGPTGAAFGAYRMR